MALDRRALVLPSDDRLLIAQACHYLRELGVSIVRVDFEDEPTRHAVLRYRGGDETACECVDGEFVQRQ